MAQRQYVLTADQQRSVTINTARARDLMVYLRNRENKWPYGEVISLLNETLNILKDDGD